MGEYVINQWRVVTGAVTRDGAHWAAHLKVYAAADTAHALLLHQPCIRIDGTAAGLRAELLRKVQKYENTPQAAAAAAVEQALAALAGG